MHPSLALQNAERELREETASLPDASSAPPPSFVKFAPRIHSGRRTMTGALAGYFDAPQSRTPITFAPNVHLRTARTVASVEAEHTQEKSSKEKKKKDGVSSIKKSHGTQHKPKNDEADKPNRTTITSSKPLRDPSTPRSDSPLTDLRAVSEESTPPLTPMSSLSDKLTLQEKKSSSKTKDELNRSTVQLLSKQTQVSHIEWWADDSSRRHSSSVEIGAKRKRVDTDDSFPRRDPPQNKAELSKRRKSKPGWKGWVEIDGSPEPKEKLINLDIPILPLETRTRSGKPIRRNSSPSPIRRRGSTATLSESTDIATPGQLPLGNSDANSAWEVRKEQV